MLYMFMLMVSGCVLCCTCLRWWLVVVDYAVCWWLVYGCSLLAIWWLCATLCCRLMYSCGRVLMLLWLTLWLGYNVQMLADCACGLCSMLVDCSCELCCILMDCGCVQWLVLMDCGCSLLAVWWLCATLCCTPMYSCGRVLMLYGWRCGWATCTHVVCQ